MLIRYETTVDDMLAFHEHHNKTSPELKKLRRAFPFLFALLTTGLLVLGFVTGEWLTGIFPILLGLSVYFWLVTWLAKPAVKSALRKHYSGAKARGVLGAHELEIVADGLIERTEYTETKTAWALLERVESTKEHTFFFTGTQKAYIVPHYAVTDGSVPAFLKAFGERYQPDGKLQLAATRTPQALTNFPPDV